jgi:hypothetical protein
MSNRRVAQGEGVQNKLTSAWRIKFGQRTFSAASVLSDRRWRKIWKILGRKIPSENPFADQGRQTRAAKLFQT